MPRQTAQMRGGAADLRDGPRRGLFSAFEVLHGREAICVPEAKLLQSTIHMLDLDQQRSLITSATHAPRSSPIADCCMTPK